MTIIDVSIAKKLQDNEVEFDHIIPISKGGSSEEHNIRLTCFECNRDKGDGYVPGGRLQSYFQVAGIIEWEYGAEPYRRQAIGA